MNYENDKNWRRLTASETIQKGDRYYSWNKDHDHYIGCNGGYGGAWYRPVTSGDNWIALSERKPTKEDAGPDGMIAFFYEPGNRAGYHQVEPAVRLRAWNEVMSATHWMPLNFVTRAPVRVKVDGHEVVPQENGDLKVGCQTVKSADFEEIVRQRQEAMK